MWFTRVPAMLLLGCAAVDARRAAAQEAPDAEQAGPVMRCGSLLNGACPKGSYCKLPQGTCNTGPENDGVCTPTPDLCIKTFDPVCGCDGVDYSNECTCLSAGVSVRSKGKCATSPFDTQHGVSISCGGEDSKSCATGYMCAALGPDEDCTVTEGTCVLAPLVCNDGGEVCGCNGETYKSECDAMTRGMAKFKDGPCEQRAPAAPQQQTDATSPDAKAANVTTTTTPPTADNTTTTDTTPAGTTTGNGTTNDVGTGSGTQPKTEIPVTKTTSPAHTGATLSVGSFVVTAFVAVLAAAAAANGHYA